MGLMHHYRLVNFVILFRLFIAQNAVDYVQCGTDVRRNIPVSPSILYQSTGLFKKELKVVPIHEFTAKQLSTAM